MIASEHNEKESNVDNESLLQKDIEYTIKMNRWLLKPIGLWPTLPTAGNLEIFLTECQILCCYFLICFLLVPCGLHTFLAEDNPALRLKMIGPMSFCLMALTKFTFLVFHRDDIYNCLEHIATDWSNLVSSGERDIMIDNAKFGRSIVIFCVSFGYSGGFFYYTIMPLSRGIITAPDNSSIRPLTYMVYDPLFAAQTSPSYEIVFITQCCSGFVMFTITIGSCSIAAVFALHACGQFKVLVSRLNKLVHEDEDKVDEKLADIVELHLRALRLVNRLENILNEVCFVELIGSTMNICFLGYYFMTEFEQSEAINTVTYCVLLLSFIFNILIFCYIGETLTEQSKGVGTMTYMIDWYQLQGTKARGLILIIVMAKYPASITAGKMAELSMNCFCNVMKTALTYLNLLRTMAN